MGLDIPFWRCFLPWCRPGLACRGPVWITHLFTWCPVVGRSRSGGPLWSPHSCSSGKRLLRLWSPSLTWCPAVRLSPSDGPVWSPGSWSSGKYLLRLWGPSLTTVSSLPLSFLNSPLMWACCSAPLISAGEHSAHGLGEGRAGWQATVWAGIKPQLDPARRFARLWHSVPRWSFCKLEASKGFDLNWGRGFWGHSQLF